MTLTDRFSTNPGIIKILAFLLISIPLAGQGDYLKKANEAFENDRFREALIYINRLEKTGTSGPLLFKRGICHFEINQLTQAMGDFQRAWEYGYENAAIDFYVGLILHHKGDFATAAVHYKKYLNDLQPENIERERVIKLIKQCGKASDLLYLKPIAVIEKLPATINTTFDEIGLIESPSRSSRYYFTSNKPNLSSSMEASDFDVYYMDLDQGSWNEPTRMRYTINKRDHDILLGFNWNADGLYLFRGKDFAGEIYKNVGFGDGSKTDVVELPSTVSLINSDVYFFSDDLVIFSSREGQGYGGYDLYASKKLDGKWSTPYNLGPEINSSFDEISPFLIADGSGLYYSSNRNESIGGFDIFYSNYLFEADKWNTPENLGIPINSPGDDTHFMLSQDGLRGLFSSNRKSAFGGMDIFVARFKEQRAILDYHADQIAFIDYEIPERIILEVNSNSSQVDLTVETMMDSINTSDLGQVPAFSKMEIKPIYYSSGMDLIDEKNSKIVDGIIKIMHEIPSLQIELSCHSSEEGILEYKLFSSLKVAERLEKYLIENGIGDKRIEIKGFADNYPVALPENKGGDYKYAEKYNSRIEIGFKNYDEDKIQFERETIDIPSHTRDYKYDLYETITENAVIYKIQIAMVSQMYRGMALDLFNDASVEKIEETNLYAYTIGLYDNYAEALDVKRKMDQLGITDARIIAYHDGNRLSEDQYVYFVNDFPDLRNMMNYSE